jgi:hypothetical protein
LCRQKSSQKSSRLGSLATRKRVPGCDLLGRNKSVLHRKTLTSQSRLTWWLPLTQIESSVTPKRSNEFLWRWQVRKAHWRIHEALECGLRRVAERVNHPGAGGEIH